jgi:hypothetical protein
MRTKIYLLLLIVFFSLPFVVQAQYGFEWIKPDQPYYKFLIGQDGVVRIPYLTLQNAALNMATLDPRKIQVFNNGKEQRIFVKGEQDGIFDVNDFIEIYVEKNIGALDSTLYEPGSQPHQYYSLFTDTSCYFITVLPNNSAVQPLRFTVFNDNNFASYLAEDYFTDEVVLAPISEYLDGPNMASSELKYLTSDYEYGEGWAGSRVAQGNFLTYTAAIPSKYNGAGNANCIFKIIGATDATRNSSGFNHHFSFSVSPNNSTFNVLAELKNAGYTQEIFNTSVDINDIGTTTYFKLQTINDLGVPADNSCLSYVKLSYPRTFDWSLNILRKFSVNNTKGGLRTKISITNFTYGNAPTILDLTDGIRVNASYAGNAATFLLNNDGRSHSVVLFDSTEAKIIPKITSVVFNQIAQTNGAEYIIVTHPIFDAATQNYEQYRSNKYTVLRVYSDELYDYFFYGVKHPLAIKRLMTYLVKEANQKPKYLLLASKGYQNDKIRINNQESQDYYNRNYVPVLGMPGADALFTSKINGTGGYPEVATGRIPALTDQELQNFLDKLIYTETTPDSLEDWQKTTIHVSGGNNETEQLHFSNQINKNRTVIQGQYVGANVVTYNKNSSSQQQENLKQQIIADQNKGANLFTFLGHASLTVLDVDIGTINDLTNVNKYLFYYFNGCNVGNVGEVDISNGSGSGNIYGKDYLCAANKGAIGWLAHSNFTFDGVLYSMMDAFYQRYCLTNYRYPIGDIMQQVSINFPTGNVLNKSHIIQWQLQGDPAFIIGNQALPDYKIASNDLFTSPNNITVQEDSFALNIVATNLGKATSDSVVISIKHTLPNGSFVQWPNVKYSSIFYKDTFVYWIKYTNMKTLLGNNSFEVILDPQSNIGEGNEFNNNAVFNSFIAGSGVSALLPVLYEKINSDTITLIAQNNNLFIENAEYLFEVDTVSSFNSQALLKSSIIKSGAIVRWRVPLLTQDSTAYYWRVRLNAPITQGGIWSESSFSKITNGNPGIAQVRFDQIKNIADNSSVNISEGNQKVEFKARYNPVKSMMKRWFHGQMGVLDPYFNTPQVGSCMGGNFGMVCVVFDKTTLKRTSASSNYITNCIVNNSGTIYEYYTFDTRSVAWQDSFIRFIDAAEPGMYLAGFSFYDAGIESWTPAIRAKFAELGLTKIPALTSSNNAFSYVVQKGHPEISIEDTIYDNSGDANSGLIAVSELEMTGKDSTGRLYTKAIGPANQWNNCTVSFYSGDTSDNYKLQIFGVKADQTDTLLLSGSNNASQIDLSSINVKQFPYIKVGLLFEDFIHNTPLQPKSIVVSYVTPTELTFNTNIKYEFYTTPIQQGDSVKVTVAVTNISNSVSDSVVMDADILNANRQVAYHYSEKIPTILPAENYIFSKHISTNILANSNSLELKINNQKEVNEVSFVNNYLTQKFEVKVDNQNPILDVTFDGYRIMNGDFVSPTPTIKVNSKDDNKFKIQSDTSTFALFLKKPGQSDYERINISDNRVVFIAGTAKSNTASIEYKPEHMADGDYSLLVQSKDVTGNLSGNNSYEIGFKVINESTITNFYPYPNPGTTNIRFVFTLTGSRPPDRLLIRIMTITGKIVKEISQDEFGPIKIGNNVSQFGWDGTDNYGDRLANGVYLYQVMSRIDGEAIKKRETSADKYLTHNTGKIYLLK